ncbi:MAG: 3-dehydroquinate synthase [Chitinophagaceae bacterium]|nr:3-dehydroquinate synthase [Chitinophagaceae bacterium]
MRTLTYTFSGKKVSCYMDGTMSAIGDIVHRDKIIIITDADVYGLHQDKFAGYSTIVIPAGEQYKQQATVDSIMQQLIRYEADRKTFIIGVGGGVVTDIAGYAAAVYMRGLSVGFVPTTILAQTDAAVGGKNGIDVGIYKNLVGTIRQPEFILYDYSFLQTLPWEQWVNGFAEVIKHACIKDTHLFDFLEKHQLKDFRSNKSLLAETIERNVVIKSEIVEQDEFEQGERKLLNFGHTLGHAIENEYQLLHGHAISIGMVAAAVISEKIKGLPASQTERISRLLQQYHLPIAMEYNKQQAFEVLKMDKKRSGQGMNFVLLEEIGKATVTNIPMIQLEQIIQAL